MSARGLRAAVRAALPQHADPRRAAQQQAYMKSSMPYWGLSSGELTAVLRPLLDDPRHQSASREEWMATVRALWDRATHREERYAALALARHKTARGFRALGALPLYRYLISTGAWWDLVDEVATHLVRDELLTDPDRVGPIVVAWARDPDLWVRRSAIICQVGAGNRCDRTLLASTIEPNLEGTDSTDAGGRQDFFIRKAIGWALRDHSKADPAWVRAFVACHRSRMAGLSIREALRHIDA